MKGIPIKLKPVTAICLFGSVGNCAVGIANLLIFNSEILKYTSWGISGVIVVVAGLDAWKSFRKLKAARTYSRLRGWTGPELEQNSNGFWMAKHRLWVDDRSHSIGLWKNK